MCIVDAIHADRISAAGLATFTPETLPASAQLALSYFAAFIRRIQAMSQPLLENVITYNPWAISDDKTLDAAIRSLNELDFHHWPVVHEGRKLVGMVSYRDIMHAAEKRAMVAAGEVTFDDAYLPNSPVCVEHFMITDVVTIGPDGTVAEVLQLMLDNRIHSVPVVEDGRLTGLITASDLIRELSYGECSAYQDLVSDHVERHDEAVDQEADLEQAKSVLDHNKTDYVLVVNGDLPMGVVSRRDVQKAQCRCRASEFLGSDLTVEGPTTLKSLVSTSPTLRPGQTLGEAATLLVESQLKAAAVVHGVRALGLISQDTLLRAMLAVL